MGYGPVPAIRKLLARAGLAIDELGILELNEAFASQVLACLRDLGLADDDPRVNPNGGAIALGHPLGMSGTRILGTAARELAATGARFALASMCVGVGQGAALLLERICYDSYPWHTCCACVVHALCISESPHVTVAARGIRFGSNRSAGTR